MRTVLVYALRRLALAVPVVLVVVVTSFLLLSVLPGDPVRVVLPQSVPEDVVLARRAELGLDRPLSAQLWSFLSGLPRGELGVSAVHREPVTAVLAGTAVPTMLLLVLGTALGVAGGVLLGVAAAWRHGRALDHGLRVVTVSGAALPPFWVGLVLLELLAVRAGWFPVGAYGTGGLRPAALVLPAVTMSLMFGALLARTVRTRVLAAFDEEHVRAAFVRGVRRRRILLGYVGGEVWPSVVALTGASLGGLLGLTVVLENVFAVPGMGAALLDAVRTRDFAVVRGICVVLALVVVLGNVLADVVRAAIDPRVRG